MARLLGDEFDKNNSGLKREWLALVASNFVSIHFPEFLRLYVNAGFVYWGLASLYLVPTNSGGSLSLMDALRLSFSTLLVIDKPAASLSGPLYDGIRMAIALVSMFWVVMFVSLSSSLVNRDAELSEESLDLAKSPAGVTESEIDSKSANTSGPVTSATLETDASAVEPSVVTIPTVLISSQTGSAPQGQVSLDHAVCAGTENSGRSIPPHVMGASETESTAATDAGAAIGPKIEIASQPSPPSVGTGNNSVIVQMTEHAEAPASASTLSAASELPLTAAAPETESTAATGAGAAIGTEIEIASQPSPPSVATEDISVIVQMTEYAEAPTCIKAPSPASEANDCKDDGNRTQQIESIRPGTAKTP